MEGTLELSDVPRALCTQLCTHGLSGPTGPQAAPQECGFAEGEEGLGDGGTPCSLRSLS